MEHGPFEDVFPIRNGDIPASYVSLPEGTFYLQTVIYLVAQSSESQTKTSAAKGFKNVSWKTLHICRYVKYCMSNEKNLVV